jgi:hypothetical protein
MNTEPDGEEVRRNSFLIAEQQAQLVRLDAMIVDRRTELQQLEHALQKMLLSTNRRLG